MSGAFYRVDDEGAEVEDAEPPAAAIVPYRPAPLAAPASMFGAFKKTVGVGGGVAVLGFVATSALLYVGWRGLRWLSRQYNEWTAGVSARDARRRAAKSAQAGPSIEIREVATAPTEAPALAGAAEAPIPITRKARRVKRRVA